MAGAGPDGSLVYRMLASGKHRLGRIMYYLRAARLFATTRFSVFSVTTVLETQPAVSAMAVRVSDLGGLFSPLVRGASLEQPHLLLTLTKPPAPVGLSAWFALSWAGLHKFNRYTEHLSVPGFQCSAGLNSPIRVQADGEYLGHTPMTVTVIPEVLRLLLPRPEPIACVQSNRA